MTDGSALLTVSSTAPLFSQASDDQLKRLHQVAGPGGRSVEMAGVAQVNRDSVDAVTDRLPLVLGMMAGAYIAFAAEGSTMAVHDVSSVGLSRFIAGVIFSTGLMLVLICGAELFTGNVLILTGVLDGSVGIAAMLRNWFWVYIGNLIGSILLAYLMYASGLWLYNGGLHGAAVIKLASSKVSLTFGQAFTRGILCNWLVCLAVWMSYAAKDISGKIWGIFFPIMLFVTSSFEHSVANMYYISAGILAKNSPVILEAAKLGDKIQLLNLQGMVNNLIPVTLGNIVGGGLFVATFYWFSYRYQSPNKTNNTVGS
jgi:formate/nitrite transporter